MAEVTFERLSSFQTNDSKYRRDPPRTDSGELLKGVEMNYDFYTVFYGYFWHGDKIMFFCPKIKNFEDELWRFFSTDQFIRFSIKKFRRFDLIEAFVKEYINEIDAVIFGQTIRLTKSDLTVAKHFSGRTCLVTVQKDNSLKWIRDWIEYHYSNSDAEAVLLFNNRTTAYSNIDLIKTLGETSVAYIHIVDVDLPYGPVLPNNEMNCFLQTGLLNFARWKHFGSAKCVFSIDIDELLSTSVRLSPLKSLLIGFGRFRGYWVYPEHPEPPFSHQSHILNTQEPMRGGKWKYYYVPHRLPTAWALGVHGVELMNTFYQKITHFLAIDRRLKFFHCRALSTNWKGKRFQP